MREAFAAAEVATFGSNHDWSEHLDTRAGWYFRQEKNVEFCGFMLILCAL
jgi:hypothetical protein